MQHQVGGHDHLLLVEAAVVSREGGAAHRSARLDIVGDDLHLGALVGEEIRCRDTGELADGVKDQHVLARGHLAGQHVPGADHQALLGILRIAPLRVLAEEGLATGGQHHDIRAQVEQGRLVGTGTQAQVDLEPRQLQLVPAGNAGDLVTLRGLGGDGDLPTQSLRGLEQGDVVAAFGSDAGRLHAAGAPAHHHDLALGALALLDDMGQAHVLPRGGGVLDAQHVEALVLAVDAVVGAHALLDLVDLPHLDLGDDMRIGDMRPGHAHQVHIAAFQDTLGLVGVLDVLGVDHRHADHVLDARRQVQEGLRRVGHVGNDVGERVVGVAAGADHAEEVHHAGGIVVGGDLLHVVVGEAVRMKLVATDAHAHHEVVADLGAHRLEHLHAEAHAVLEAAAPLVLALVDPRTPELVDQVLVHGGELDAVEAAFLGPARGLGEITDDAPDLLLLDGLAGGAVHRLAYPRGRHQGRPVEAVPARTAPHMGDLDHDLAAVLVDGSREVLEVRNDAVGGEVNRAPPALGAVNGDHRRAAADAQATAALGLLLVVPDVAVGGHAAVGGVHLGVGGADHAIANGQLADLDRLEDRVECHENLLNPGRRAAAGR